MLNTPAAASRSAANAQDDRQDHVEQEHSEGGKEAEFEGSAGSNPDLVRRRHVLGGHVPTVLGTGTGRGLDAP